MKDLRCDNTKCKYNYEDKCIQFWYCTIGVDRCPMYKRIKMSPEEIYEDILKDKEDSNDKDKDEE